MNQTQQVKQHLMSGRSITSYQAFELYGITRLSAKIHELRKAGMDIDTIDREIVDRYGDKKVIAEYRYFH